MGVNYGSIFRGKEESKDKTLNCYLIFELRTFSVFGRIIWELAKRKEIKDVLLQSFSRNPPKLFDLRSENSPLMIFPTQLS